MLGSQIAVPQTKLICPRCVARQGGKATAKKYGKQLAKWGRKGGKTKRKSQPLPPK